MHSFAPYREPAQSLLVLLGIYEKCIEIYYDSMCGLDGHYGLIKDNNTRRVTSCTYKASFFLKF